MKTFVMAATPSLAKAVLENLSSTSSEPSFLSGAAAPAHAVLGMSFVFPRGQSFASYPNISEPIYRPIGETSAVSHQGRGSDFSVPFAYQEVKYGRVTHVDLERGGADNRSLLSMREADRILLCIGSSPTDCHGATRTMEFLREQNPGAGVEVYGFTDVSSPDVSLSLKQPLDWEEVRARSVPSIVKRYFDYNFLKNRNAILRRTFDLVGIPRDRRLPSKFGIQLLYWLSEEEGPVDITALRREIREWKGTGRYGKSDQGVLKRTIRLCHRSAEEAVLNDLESGNLIVRSGTTVEVTDTGREFLRALHPGCRDLDLPYRLAEWQTIDQEDATTAIAKYLRTWFGRQKRFDERKRVFG